MTIDFMKNSKGQFISNWNGSMRQARLYMFINVYVLFEILFRKISMVTEHNSSCGKVMFSQASAILSTGLRGG